VEAKEPPARILTLKCPHLRLEFRNLRRARGVSAWVLGRLVRPVTEKFAMALD